jgi:hypothetical protein
MPAIPALGRLRREGCKLQARLGYKARLSQITNTQKPHLLEDNSLS